MSKFLSGRERELKVGIVSYSENKTVLEVVGNSNFTGIVTATSFQGDGSNLTNIPASGISISTTAPGSPSSGTLWYNSEEGRTFVYYNDGSSAQWVDASPSNASGGSSSGSSTVSIGQTAPGDPSSGDLWYSTDFGRIFVYYDEPTLGIGSTSVWVDAAPYSLSLIHI